MDESYVATVNASGVGVATIWPGNLDTWIVQQVTVEMATAPSGATCNLRKNKKLVTPMIPQGGVAGGDPPVEVGPGDRLTVTWAGCTPGAIGEVFIIYDLKG